MQSHARTHTQRWCGKVWVCLSHMDAVKMHNMNIKVSYCSRARATSWKPVADVLFRSHVTLLKEKHKTILQYAISNCINSVTFFYKTFIDCTAYFSRSSASTNQHPGLKQQSILQPVNSSYINTGNSISDTWAWCWSVRLCWASSLPCPPDRSRSDPPSSGRRCCRERSQAPCPANAAGSRPEKGSAGPVKTEEP